MPGCPPALSIMLHTKSVPKNDCVTFQIGSANASAHHCNTQYRAAMIIGARAVSMLHGSSLRTKVKDNHAVGWNAGEVSLDLSGLPDRPDSTGSTTSHS